MGRPQGDGEERHEARNEISGGDINGPVGQFGSVHGDVHMNWSGRQDPAELAKAVEEALTRAERAREEARREAERREREARDAEQDFQLLIALGVGVLVFLVLFFGFDLWWWVAGLLALAAAGKVAEL
ncbi:hypothetical protein RM844_04460 [Streptomyces sp. DSM 44915]|uniref:DUF3040 domain-containing protein n=1 Tax=Streptomyces chisholmiae TaxID=3075540 RepID=A0ABU2JKN3_9ACTN|nr:hypothetical protein [Streptomyces sp. DSM 44915]MDT0265541.1 hypothetical protein [Streptomyces sp. DSM 44915]